MRVFYVTNLRTCNIFLNNMMGILFEHIRFHCLLLFPFTFLLLKSLLVQMNKSCYAGMYFIPEKYLTGNLKHYYII